MKKIFIFIAILITLSIAVAVAVAIHNNAEVLVTFKLKKDNTEVSIYKSDLSSTRTKITKSQIIKLKPGKYYYLVQGVNLSDDQYSFEVKDSPLTVVVDPPYSDSYLINLAQKEKPSIIDLLKSKYNTILKDYVIKDFWVYKDGTWGAGYLMQDVDPRQDSDIYRYVVQNTNGNWNFIATPQLTINKFDYPAIPNEVLTSINRAFLFDR